MSHDRTTGAETGLDLYTGTVSGSDLVRDYLAGQPRLAPFFAGFPYDPEAFRRKAAAVHARLKPEARSRVAAAMAPTSTGAAERMRRMLAGYGLAVTTGQQAGLFGGPLYTTYKLLTAIGLARSLESLLAQPVVPVFWVAADDHDWLEVNHTSVVDGANEVRRVELAGPEQPPLPMSERRLGDAIEATLDAFLQLLPESEFAAPWAELLRRCYRPDATVAGAFREMMLGLFAEFDVVLFDPSHPAVKKEAAPLLWRELEQSAAHASLLETQSARLVEAGYHAQVTIAREAANLSYSDEQGRDRLVRENDTWHLRRTRRTFTTQDLEARLRSEPERFSPNVLLRPVVESALLPTVAYVGGPAEVAYFAQIGCLFDAHGIEPPLVVPRRSAIVIEPKVRRVLDKFELAPADLMQPFHEVVTRLVRGELPEEVRGPLASLRNAIGAGYDALGAGAAAIDPTLEAWIRNLRNQSLGQVENAEKKILSHLKKRGEIEIDQLRKAAANLYPGGAPQERVLNIFPLLARYGPGLLRDLAGVMQVAPDRSMAGWSGVDC